MIEVDRGGVRGLGRLGRITYAALALVILGAAALPIAHGLLQRSGGCQPQSWVDWHIAMKQACLTPAYVCENMTTSKMLADPEIRESYRRAFEAGAPEVLAGLDALVSEMRTQFGCADAKGEPSAPGHPHAEPSLPPGHPPIPGRRGSPPPYGFDDSQRSLSI
jgi:hypothetical protein